MRAEEFQSFFEVVNKICDGDVDTYSIRDSSGSRAMAHFLRGSRRHTEELMSRFDTVSESAQGLVRHTLEVDGSPVIVTDWISGFDTFEMWVERENTFRDPDLFTTESGFEPAARPVVPVTEPHLPNPVTEPHVPAPEPAIPVPPLADPAEEPVEFERPVATPREGMGEFTKLFNVPGSTDATEPDPPPASAPASPPTPPTSEPVVPEPVISEAVIPEAVHLAPVTPDPVAPQPVAPEPVVPDPIAPDPVAPDPMTAGQPADSVRPTSPKEAAPTTPVEVRPPEPAGSLRDEKPEAAGEFTSLFHRPVRENEATPLRQKEARRAASKPGVEISDDYRDRLRGSTASAEAPPAPPPVPGVVEPAPAGPSAYTQIIGGQSDTPTPVVAPPLEVDALEATQVPRKRWPYVLALVGIVLLTVALILFALLAGGGGDSSEGDGGAPDPAEQAAGATDSQGD